MDILCLHYYYPPLRSTAVIRNYQFSLAFAEIFDHVHILTSDNYLRCPSEQLPLPNNLSVQDVYTLDYRTAMGRKSERDSHISMKKKSSPLFQYLLKIQKSFPFNLVLGEGALVYIYNAYRKASKIITQHDVTTIYSSFAPYADHYVAHLLKKKYPYLKWIADFRDLQVEPIYKNVIGKGLQRKVERFVLKNADKVTSVSESYADQLRIYGRPTQSIFRGINLRDEVEKLPVFTISYTGSLYFDYRDPSQLFSCISSCISEGLIDQNKIQIIYAGRDGVQFGEYISNYGLDQIFLNKGMMSQNESKELQSRSHINLLLTSSSPELKGVITGKVFEYFEAGSPIVALIKGVKDIEFERLFKKLSAGVVTYDPPLEQNLLKSFILKHYNDVQHTGTVQHIINKKTLINEYSWHNQAIKTLNVIDDKKNNHSL